LVRVLEEHLDPPAVAVRPGDVGARCVDLVGHEVLDGIVAAVDVLLGDDHFHVTEFGDRQLLGPDVVGVAVDVGVGIS